MNIRKFVGIAAGFGAAVALGLSAQTAVAHVGGQPTGAAPTTDLTSLSPACMAALQAIRSAIVADRQEDADEAQNPAAAGAPLGATSAANRCLRRARSIPSGPAIRRALSRASVYALLFKPRVACESSKNSCRK